jgi:glycerophosphoryl diester phosphodiesterase
MIQNLQVFWQEAFSILRRAWAQIVAIHLAYICLGLVLFSPITGLLGQCLLRISGKTVLSDLDIAYFFLTPLGGLALLLFSALLLAIIIFEQASIMAVCQAVLHKKRLAFIPALRFTLQRIHRIYSFAIRLILRLFLLTLPFLGLALALAWVMLSEYDINYYLLVKPPALFVAAASIGLVLVTMTVVLSRHLISWSLSLPLLLFSTINPAASFAKSEALCHGRTRFFLVPLGSLALAMVCLHMLLLLLLQLLGSALAPFAFQSMQLLVPLLGGLAILLFTGNLLLSTLGSGAFGASMMLLYRGSGEASLAVAGATTSQQKSKQLSPTLLLSILLLLAISAIFSGTWLLNSIPTSNNTMIIAHRGAAGKAPENTLVAMQHAIQDGADWLEIDVQESIDGEVVVIHDSDFMKLAGINKKVWNSTLTEIKKIDVGSWFNAGFSRERVPTLEELLLLAKGKCKVLIELKYYGHDLILEQRVAEIVEAVDMVDQVAIMSLDIKGITRFKNLRPQWPIGLLSTTAIGKISDLELQFLALNMATAKPALIRRIQATGKQVYVWTVNDRASMARMMALGVDGIITDEPAMAFETRKTNADLTPVERLLLLTAVLFDAPLPQQTYRDQSP